MKKLASGCLVVVLGFFGLMVLLAVVQGIDFKAAGKAVGSHARELFDPPSPQMTSAEVQSLYELQRTRNDAEQRERIRQQEREYEERMAESRHQELLLELDSLRQR